jgi:hypothetical protein
VHTAAKTEEKAAYSQPLYLQRSEYVRIPNNNQMVGAAVSAAVDENTAVAPALVPVRPFAKQGTPEPLGHRSCRQRQIVILKFR